MKDIKNISVLHRTVTVYLFDDSYFDSYRLSDDQRSNCQTGKTADSVVNKKVLS